MTGILFDLDGTLLDSLGDLTDSVNYALTQFGYPTRTLEEIRTFVGNGAGKLIARSVPQGADPAPVLACYQAYYRDHCRIKTAPYPGVLDALEKLAKEYPVAIVSNKPDKAVKILCADYFPGVYARGESADCARKPQPDMLFKTMQTLNVDSAVYVGDSEVDIQTARNANMPCISVLWGFRDRAILEEYGAAYFCEDAALLPAMIHSVLEETNGI